MSRKIWKGEMVNLLIEAGLVNDYRSISQISKSTGLDNRFVGTYLRDLFRDNVVIRKESEEYNGRNLKWDYMLNTGNALVMKQMRYLGLIV